LTLLAGIYGMNFKYMPELAWEYAYPAVLSSMALSAIVLLLYFVNKGWFAGR
jgi:magnesium transporter